ncbi:lipase family protein, putative [Ichthyophthirius multifiliis]|uniref:Lipase family protein, putative n=1 Tax=Ichthyophthirius multifiliis TaxID=5932 RepID=G0R2R3_ICHMU|nr:lipase family protein, putative [Ichthyophthirius multifiliis]EGR28245.1 lipase family protein, putative [Ichthyophthirius multifiliis]|eukprot:XP_004027590.1 lipase family protein, putative [Ichthyophthirius multifiliis]
MINLITDINALQVAYDKCDQCKVHKGFYSAFQGIKDKIQQAFQELQQKYPSSKVFLTGHSLGGALATLFLPEVYEWNGKKQLDAFYTFGQPRVGNKQFGLWLQKNELFSISKGRVTHNKDPIVGLGPIFLNYYHFGYEIFYKSFNENEKYTFCEKPEDSNCASGVSSQTSLQDHVSYYGFNWTVTRLLCQ